MNKKNNEKLTAEDKKLIDFRLSKFEKERIKQNIRVLENLKFSRLAIMDILKTYPQVLMCEPNQNNPNSITARLEFWSQFTNNVYHLVIYAPKILTVDVDDNPDLFAVIDNLRDYGLSNEKICTIIKRNPEVLEYASDGNAQNFEQNLRFWFQFAVLNQKEKIRDISDFFVRGAKLLTYDQQTAQEKLQYIKAFFDVDNVGCAQMVYKYPNIVGMDTDPNSPNSIAAKTQKLSELGLSVKDVANNPVILAAPINKVKLRYILANNAGMKNSVFAGGKFAMDENKLYARAQYLSAPARRSFAKSMLYTYEADFHQRTGKWLSDLIAEGYVLTKEVMLAQQDQFNKNRSNKIYLTDEELDSITQKFVDDEDEQNELNA